MSRDHRERWILRLFQQALEVDTRQSVTGKSATVRNPPLQLRGPARWQVAPGCRLEQGSESHREMHLFAVFRTAR